MPNVYCVRAEFGTYTKPFLDGGYAAIGWLPHIDLSSVRAKEELYPLYKQAYPNDTSNVSIGVQVGQIARFLFDIKAGDFVITPPANTEFLNYGIVEPDPSYSYFEGKDGCPYPHRRHISWNSETVRRSDFSVPFQNTIRSSLTVYNISHADHFFEVIGRSDLVGRPRKDVFDSYRAALDHLLELTATEFEILITHLLAALGFEGTEHTGKTGDGGVDATGELNVANLAKIKIFVQVKRYQLGSKISANTVKALRQSVPSGGQGAFITTADFHNAASDVALEVGFPRIGLIKGRQLVDLLIEYWADIPNEFKEKLGLKLGLVPS